LSYETIKIAFDKAKIVWQRSIWASQFYSFERQNFTQAKPRVLTKKQVIDIAFSLRTQAVD